MRDIRCLLPSGQVCDLIDLPSHLWERIAAAPPWELAASFNGDPESLRERIEIEHIIRSFE